MAFRTRRQHRYEVLRKIFCLKFEAFAWSKVPFYVPYMNELMKGRFKSFDKAMKEGKSREEFSKEIKKEYRDRGYLKRNRLGQAVGDPWAYLRDFEHKYRSKHPEYESPWLPRQRRFRDFMKKIEGTIKKYPKGRAYTSKAEASRRMRETKGAS